MLPPGLAFQGEALFLFVYYILYVCCSLISIISLDPSYGGDLSFLIFVPSDPPWKAFHLYLDKPPVVCLASLDVFLDNFLLKPLRFVVGGVWTCPFPWKCVDISLISPLSVQPWRFCVALAFQSVVGCVFWYLVTALSRRFPGLADLDAQVLMVDAVEWSPKATSGVHFWSENLQLFSCYGLQMMGCTADRTLVFRLAYVMLDMYVFYFPYVMEVLLLCFL